MRSKLLNEIASTMKIIIILIKICIKRSCNASNESLTSKHWPTTIRMALVSTAILDYLISLHFNVTFI